MCEVYKTNKVMWCIDCNRPVEALEYRTPEGFYDEICPRSKFHVLIKPEFCASCGTPTLDTFCPNCKSLIKKKWDNFKSNFEGGDINEILNYISEELL